MKKFLLTLFFLQFALLSSAYFRPWNIKWIAEDNVYVTTVAKAVAYRLPYCRIFEEKYLENKEFYRECIPYTNYKKKKINKPKTFKVRGYVNRTEQLHYDTYVIEIKEVLYFLPATSVQDNKAIDAVNKALTDQLNSLTLAIEQAKKDYKEAYLSIRNAYTDSLVYYKHLKKTLPDSIKSIKEKIRADFKTIEKEEFNNWYNGLSKSAKRTYDNVLALSSSRLRSPNSAGGCDYTIYYKNKSHKTIKYVNFSIDFYNAVDDRVYCEIRGRSSCSCKDTGPIYQDECGGGTWDCVIYNHSADYAKLTSLSIIYTDGTQVSITVSDINQLLTEPNFLFGSQKAIEKFGGNESFVTDKAIDHYERQLKNIDNEIEKWSKRVEDINAEDFSVSYKERDDKHKNTFYTLRDLKSIIGTKEKELRGFKICNFLYIR